MQTTKIVAIAAVLAMVAAAGIGLGYAFQATYTDQISGTESTTGQFLKVEDATYSGDKAIKIEDTTASTLFLDCGTDVTKSGGSYTRTWDAVGAILSATSTGAAISTTYDISTKAANQASITVKALYCLGAYKVTAPVNSTTATVAVTNAIGTASQSATNYAATSSDVYYILSTDATYDELTATESVLTLSDQTIGTTGTTYYLYAVAVWVLGAPNADAPAATLTLAASTPTVTATATTYGA